MAVQNLSFACACECAQCSRFFTRTAIRPWIGMELGMVLFDFIIHHRLRFLRYHQTNTALPVSRIPAQDFTWTWSVERNPNRFGDRTGGSEQSLDTLFAARLPMTLLAEPGIYHITTIDDTTAWRVDSFLPAETYSIFIHAELTLAGQTLIMDSEYSDWLSPARMEEMLRSDLDNLEPSPIHDFTAPHWDFTHGGYVDRCDNPAPTPDDGSVGYALRWIRPDDTTNQSAVLRRSVIYVNGAHSITEHPAHLLGNNPPSINCQNITIPAGGSYNIEPPSTEARAILWRENQSCQ